MVRVLRRFSSLHKIYNYTFIYLSFELFRRLSIVVVFFLMGVQFLLVTIAMLAREIIAKFHKQVRSKE